MSDRRKQIGREAVEVSEGYGREKEDGRQWGTSRFMRGRKDNVSREGMAHETIGCGHLFSCPHLFVAKYQLWQGKTLAGWLYAAGFVVPGMGILLKHWDCNIEMSSVEVTTK